MPNSRPPRPRPFGEHETKSWLTICQHDLIEHGDSLLDKGNTLVDPHAHLWDREQLMYYVGTTSRTTYAAMVVTICAINRKQLGIELDDAEYDRFASAYVQHYGHDDNFDSLWKAGVDRAFVDSKDNMKIGGPARHYLWTDQPEVYEDKLHRLGLRQLSRAAMPEPRSLDIAGVLCSKDYTILVAARKTGKTLVTLYLVRVWLQTPGAVVLYIDTDHTTQDDCLETALQCGLDDDTAKRFWWYSGDDWAGLTNKDKRSMLKELTRQGEHRLYVVIDNASGLDSGSTEQQYQDYWERVNPKLIHEHGGLLALEHHDRNETSNDPAGSRLKTQRVDTTLKLVTSFKDLKHQHSLDDVTVKLKVIDDRRALYKPYGSDIINYRLGASTASYGAARLPARDDDVLAAIHELGQGEHDGVTAAQVVEATGLPRETVYYHLRKHLKSQAITKVSDNPAKYLTATS